MPSEFKELNIVIACSTFQLRISIISDLSKIYSANMFASEGDKSSSFV